MLKYVWETGMREGKRMDRGVNEKALDPSAPSLRQCSCGTVRAKKETQSL